MVAGKGPLPPLQVSRRRLLRGALGGVAGLGLNDKLPSGVTPSPASLRRVGIDYSLWHKTEHWQRVWGTPSRGFYRSDNRAVIRAHAAQLHEAGVDFLILDASNDIGSDVRTNVGIPYQQFEEHVTALIFDEYARMQRRPNLCFMLGYVPNSNDLVNGRLSAKASEIHDVYVQDIRYNRLFEIYEGRPLLIIYGETPARYQNSLPPWSDPRFTVRFMTAGLTQQPALLGSVDEHREHVSWLGYWSWQDRGASSYPVVDGHPEAMMITAFWPDDIPNHHPGRGRMGGKLYRAEWQRARRIGPRFLIAGTFNEWIASEQPSAEMSKDVEPSLEHGNLYLDIIRDEATRFRAGR